MQRWLSVSMVAAGFVGLFAFVGCTKDDKPPQPEPKGSTSAAAAPAPVPPKAAPTEMSLLIFSEYIDEKIVADFEKDAKIRLRITTYESSEEMESKLSYGGADAQYDVVVAASQSLPRLVRKDLIRPLDHAKLPNLKNLDAKFSGAAFDDGNKHGAPYQWGTVGIMYDKKKHPKLDPSWSVVLDPKKVAGTFVLLDEMRDMVGAVLKYKGYSSNSTTAEQVREAGRILQEAKSHPKCLGFKGGVGAVQDVKAGSADIAVVWNGDALKEIDEDKERLTYVVPKEGSVMWVDAMMITKRAPSPELAHRFINFILDPDIGSRLSVYNRYASPNAAAKARLPAEDQANAVIYPAADMMGRLEYHRDLGTNQTVYDEVWTAVKAQ